MTPELSVTSLFIYLHATPRADEFLRRAFPATFSSGLQRSLSILSGTEAISLWPKEKLGGRKKKKNKASLFASFPNGAGLGTADADSVLESTTCHSSLTRQLDTTSPNVAAEPTRGNVLCCLPKTNSNRGQLLPRQIFTWEGFPYI